MKQECKGILQFEVHKTYFQNEFLAVSHTSLNLIFIRALMMEAISTSET
jgi:hypothetical protein